MFNVRDSATVLHHPRSPILSLRQNKAARGNASSGLPRVSRDSSLCRDLTSCTPTDPYLVRGCKWTTFPLLRPSRLRERAGR